MKIISHRGNGNIYKANTKEALLKAINTSYIDGIELDIRMTLDNQIVIIHDITIGLISDGRGIVTKMIYNELLKYNFGTSKYPSKICLLEELLKEVKNFKIILIDIKQEINNEIIIDKLFQILKKYQHLNIYIMSFNYDLIRQYKDKYNGYCGLLIGNYINTDKLYNTFDFNIITYNYRKRVEKKETFLWTINSKKEDIDNYNIITDKPSLFYQ